MGVVWEWGGGPTIVGYCGSLDFFLTSCCETDIRLLGALEECLCLQKIILWSITTHDHNFLMHCNQIPLLGTGGIGPFRGTFESMMLFFSKGWMSNLLFGGAKAF